MTAAKSSSEDAELTALKSNPDSTVGELADAAGMGRSTAGKALVRLERAERVRRTAGVRDGGRRCRTAGSSPRAINPRAPIEQQAAPPRVNWMGTARRILRRLDAEGTSTSGTRPDGATARRCGSCLVTLPPATAVSAGRTSTSWSPATLPPQVRRCWHGASVGATRSSWNRSSRSPRGPDWAGVAAAPPRPHGRAQLRHRGPRIKAPRVARLRPESEAPAAPSSRIAGRRCLPWPRDDPRR